MREARFKSQNALHRASGVPQATISRILSGDGKKGPETETIRKLAAACNVNFEWLNEGIGPKHREERKGAGVHHLAPVKSAEPVSEDQRGVVINTDEMIELLALYQQATDRGRRFILESARVADKREVARWIRATNHKA